MKLSDLRAWFFELIAVIIPGAFTFLMLIAIATVPVPIDVKSLFAQVEMICFPFKQPWANAGCFLSVAFAIGHIVQQLSVYLMRIYGKLRRKSYRNCIDDIFSLLPVREYLLPKASGLEIGSMPLTNNDVFMMTYPDVAPKTKRDTFIAVSAFCGALAVVSLFMAVTAVIFCVRLRLNSISPSWLKSAALVTLSGGLALLWLDRCSFFYDLADRVVVNYFLSKVGSKFRTENNSGAYCPFGRNVKIAISSPECEKTPYSEDRMHANNIKDESHN